MPNSLATKELKQWEKRLVAFKFIYAVLMLGCNEQELVAKWQAELADANLNHSAFKVVLFFFKNSTYLTNLIAQHLHAAWKIERLNMVDLANLYQALSEYYVLHLPKKIVIDQAIITAKKYGEEASYKFINFLLDQILSEKHA